MPERARRADARGARARTPPPSPAAVADAGSERLRALGAFVLLGLVVAAVYAGAVHTPFIFDDRVAIVDNESIVRLWPPIGDADAPGPLNPPPLAPTARRPLPNLTFALNYRFGGLDPFGYHLVNLLLHVLAASLLAAIVRRTLRLPYFGVSDRVAWALALAVALVWAVHPLNSESVVNVTQRTELLGAVCYLGALWAALRWWSAGTPRERAVWVAVAALMSAAGMASKEIVVTVPIAVWLYDRTFRVDSVRATRSSWPLYAALASGWLVLVLLSLGGFPGLVDERHRIPAWVWWITQTKILFLYLKLAVWPWPLSIHYAPDYLRSFAAAAPWIAAAVALGAVTLALVWRRPAARFVVIVVVFVLGPTLVVPLPKMIAAERRMYLPLAGLVALAVVAGWRALAARNAAVAAVRIACAVAAVAVVGFGALTVRRVAAYETAVTIWRDAVRRQPTDAMSHYNLGVALVDEHRDEEALRSFEQTLRLEPDHVMALDNLGAALERLGRPQDAVAPLEEAIRLDPHDAVAHNNLGSVLIKLGRANDAVVYLERALALMHHERETITYLNLGRALVGAGRAADAIPPLEEVLWRRPDDTDARIFLAHALLQAGRGEAAVEQYRRALEQRPDDASTRSNLAIALLQLGRTPEAIASLEQALRTNPAFAAAHYNLGRALLASDRPRDAVAHFEQAVRLQPGDAQARFECAVAYARSDRPADASLMANDALAAARARGDAALAAEIAAWLDATPLANERRDARGR
jgi:tetratricopeptide (TPR) repeat protein